MNCWEIFADLLLTYCFSEDLVVFGADCSAHELSVEFFVTGGVGHIHAATEIDHDDHALDWHFLNVGRAVDGPVFDNCLLYTVFVGFGAVEAGLAGKVDSTVLAVDHQCIGEDSMGIFFVEIFDGVSEGIGDVAFDLIQEVLPVLF